MDTSVIGQPVKLSDQFWFSDPSILWKRERLQEFFPTKTLSVEEQFNAAVRFSAYVTVALYLFTQKSVFLYILPITLVVTKIGYDVGNREKLATKVVPALPVTKSDGVDNGLTEGNPTTIQNGRKCVVPTKDNPFMNVLLSDYKYDADRPSACNVEDPAIKKRSQSYFYDSLYRDADDVFGRDTNSRQWVTTPLSKLPGSEQRDFANWCFGGMGQCKDTGNMLPCSYNDVRQQRSPHFEIYE